jgi:hypothetical protein
MQKRKEGKKRKGKPETLRGEDESEIFSFNPLHSTPWRMNIEFQPDIPPDLQ